MILVATVACSGHDAGPTSATSVKAPVGNPPAVIELRTYLAGSTTSYVDFSLTDPDGDAITWQASVATLPGCRCAAGPLRLWSLDQQVIGNGAAPSGTVRSGTLVRLFYWPGGGPVNNVVLTIDASDPSGGAARATIEVPNW
jgi:hypothetical protein